MPQRTAMKNIDVARDKRFWLLASAMIVGQLLAFWLLCTFQVHRAQVREAALQAERTAAVDCLRSSPGVARGCAGNAIASRDGAASSQAGWQAAMKSAVPVNYVYWKP